MIDKNDELDVAELSRIAREVRREAGEPERSREQIGAEFRADILRSMRASALLPFFTYRKFIIGVALIAFWWFIATHGITSGRVTGAALMVGGLWMILISIRKFYLECMGYPSDLDAPWNNRLVGLVLLVAGGFLLW